MSQGSPSSPHLQYQTLMMRIRARFDLIDMLRPSNKSDVSTLETVAFHLRKIIEGAAFGCLVAVENGLKRVPKDAVGHWNADKIFSSLKKRDQLAFPEPFERKDPTPECPPGIHHHIVPRKEFGLSVDELRKCYQRTHAWLHEWNPYVADHVKDFDKRRAALLADQVAVRNLLWQHLIGIGGELFLGFLKDPADGQVRVASASKDVGSQ